MRETEIKFRLDSFEEMERRLEALGCEAGPELRQTSMLLDGDHRHLGRSGRTLRVRVSGNRLFLTAKSAESSDGLAKQRHEREVEVRSDLGELLSLLELLGYRVCLIYHRTRRQFALGRATVCLDRMDFGTYMEIEAGSLKDLRRACDSLGLDLSQGDTRSYPELMELHGAGREEK